MFLLKHQLGEDIRNVRKELKLTKEKLARLSGINVKTLRLLENGKRIGKIETFLKIKNALQKNFNFDLAERAGIKIIWDLEDLDSEGLNIIKGGLLGDGCVTKYGTYQQEAKDKKYLEWLGGLLNKNGINCKVISIKHKNSYSKSKTFYCLYTHSCPAFFELRKRWYIENDEGKKTKRIPADIKLTPITLLHWYLGDGNLKHDNRKFPKGGKPPLRLFVNDFLKEDIELLLQKLKKNLGLNFYTSPKLNRNTEKGYILYLYSTDLFKFFKVIGLESPKEIKDSITEIRNGKPHTFKEKWPDKHDWIKIFAKTKGVGKLLQERRKELGLTQRDLAEEVGVKKHQISQIECGRKGMSLQSFIKILNILKLSNFEAFLLIIYWCQIFHIH